MGEREPGPQEGFQGSAPRTPEGEDSAERTPSEREPHFRAPPEAKPHSLVPSLAEKGLESLPEYRSGLYPAEYPWAIQSEPTPDQRNCCSCIAGSDINVITERWKNSLDLLGGCPGTEGPKGPDGKPGDQGAIGLPGLTESIGITGEQGDVGEIGLPGDIGPPGTIGETGYDGPQGEKGEIGDPADGPRNCKDLMDLGLTLTGWYYIYPDGSPLRVMCDMETDGGGWIVFQRRWDGSVDFYRDFESYKKGFGNQWSEFWLGNENIHALTANGKFQLRIDLGDFDNNHTYATYEGFSLGGESEQYTLYLSEYTGGTAGDALSYHKNQKFSTKDRDGDGSRRVNCAVFYTAPWWHEACFDSSLNGLYLKGEHTEKGGIAWSKFRGIQYSLKFSEMKFRPVEEEEW